MYLDVTFKDGTVSHCVLTASHTIQIVNPQAQIQDAFSLDGVASVALNVAGNPAATDPTPPDFSGAAEGATITETPIGEPSDNLSVAADPTPPPAESASDTPSDSETEATPPGDEAPPAPDASA